MAYDKLHTGIGSHLLQNQMIGLHKHSHELELLDKISVFLKISSGTYNLVRPFEEESLMTKYKNAQIFPYLIYLFNVLKNEYEHCEQRLERDSLEITRSVIEKNLKDYQSNIKNCIHPYFTKLFK
jgi:hypothetical protein